MADPMNSPMNNPVTSPGNSPMNSKGPGKGIFFGNIKGGVGKSTLCAFLYEMLREKLADHRRLLIDTDPQAASSSMLSPILPPEEIKQMPLGDRYDGAVLSALDGVLRSLLVHDKTLVLVDSGGGKIGNIWQIVMLCDVVIVPTSLSWMDLRPTHEYMREIHERKQDLGATKPHIILLPNRISPHQRNYSVLSQYIADISVTIAPPVPEYAIVRKSSFDYSGIDSIRGSKFFAEVERFADFLITQVFEGGLDQYFSTSA